MTVLELVKILLDQPLDAEAYVGKGMGPAASVAVMTTSDGNRVVVVSPSEGR